MNQSSLSLCGVYMGFNDPMPDQVAQLELAQGKVSRNLNYYKLPDEVGNYIGAVIKTLLILCALMALTTDLQAQGIVLKNCFGEKAKIKPGGVVSLTYFKEVACEKCAICNYHKVEGEIVGFSESQIVLLTSETEESTMDAEGNSKLVTTKMNYVSGNYPANYDLSKVGSITYHSASRIKLRDYMGTIAVLAAFYNLIITPALMAATGEKRLNWNRYWNVSAPGLIVLGASIPLAIAGTHKKQFPIRPAYGAPELECPWIIQ
jgi:hypothetical protein